MFVHLLGVGKETIFSEATSLTTRLTCELPVHVIRVGLRIEFFDTAY